MELGLQRNNPIMHYALCIVVQKIAKAALLHNWDSSKGLGFLDPRSQLRHANVSGFCMQLENQLVKYKVYVAFVKVKTLKH